MNVHNDMIDHSKRLTITVPEAARLLGISRMSAYNAAASGELPTIRIGKRLLVPRAALERLLDVRRNKGEEERP